MSDPTLVIRFGELDTMVAALVTAHDAIVEQVGTLRGDVDDLLVGWAADTASRQAQLGYDRRLATGVEDLTAALESVRAALATVSEDAHDAEVRNVAIMD